MLIPNSYYEYGALNYRGKASSIKLDRYSEADATSYLMDRMKGIQAELVIVQNKAKKADPSFRSAWRAYHHHLVSELSRYSRSRLMKNTSKLEAKPRAA